MLLRLILFVVLAVLVARAFWRLVDGIVEGVTGKPPASRVPTRGVQMVRDPVCGTFVVPDRALAVTVGNRQIFFCSTACRDKYRTRPSTGSGRAEPAEGRSA